MQKKATFAALMLLIFFYLFACGVLQPLGQFRGQSNQLFVLQRPICHLRNQLSHQRLGIPLKLVAVLCLLLIHRNQVLPEDLSCKRRLDLPDALLGEIALFGICGEDNHVDMNLVVLTMEGRIPTEVIDFDLIALRNIRNDCISLK